MLDFEKEFPQIADKYFDLRFDKENIYKIQYGYGRKYENKPLCKYCKEKSLCWDKILKNTNNPDIQREFIQLYFTKEIDTLCLKYENAECNVTSRKAAIYVKDVLLNYSIKELVNIIKMAKSFEKVTKNNIPRFSNFNVSAFDIINTIMDYGVSKMNCETLGKYLTKSDNISDSVFQKYVWNHTKLAALLDLINIGKFHIFNSLIILAF